MGSARALTCSSTRLASNNCSHNERTKWLFPVYRLNGWTRASTSTREARMLPGQLHRSTKRIKTASHKSVAFGRFGAGIAGGRRCMIRFGRRAEDFGEDRFQTVGPDLVAFQARMQFVFRHAFEKFSVLVRQFVVHVQVTNFFPVRQFGQVLVEAVDRGNDRHVVVARKNCGQNDDGIRSFGLADFHERLQSARDVLDLGLPAWKGSDVVDAGEHDDDFWIHSIKFAILETPEHVFDQVRAPTKIARVPSEEIGVPVREEFRVIGRSPTPRDRVTNEINVDAAFPGFFEEVLVGDLRIPIRSRRGFVRGPAKPSARTAIRWRGGRRSLRASEIAAQRYGEESGDETKRADHFFLIQIYILKLLLVSAN